MMSRRLHQLLIKKMPAIIHHPFNQGLYLGSLPRHQFEFYLRQDCLYLRELSIALKSNAKRMTNPTHAHLLREFSVEMINAELEIQSKYLIRGSGISFFGRHLESKKIAVVSDYIHHLHTASNERSLGEGIASCSPCFLSYAALGRQFNSVAENNPYYDWIKSYSTPWFIAAGEKMLLIVDALSEKANEGEKEKMVRAFEDSIDYEIAFWEYVHGKKDLINRESEAFSPTSPLHPPQSISIHYHRERR